MYIILKLIFENVSGIAVKIRFFQQKETSLAASVMSWYLHKDIQNFEYYEQHRYRSVTTVYSFEFAQSYFRPIETRDWFAQSWIRPLTNFLT